MSEQKRVAPVPEVGVPVKQVKSMLAHTLAQFVAAAEMRMRGQAARGAGV